MPPAVMSKMATGWRGIDRQRMEDVVAISDNIGGCRCYAVFDGHGGDKATHLAGPSESTLDEAA